MLAAPGACAFLRSFMETTRSFSRGGRRSGSAGNTTEAEILVIVAHPELEQSRANRRLLQAARALQQKSPAARLAVRDLYALYPDYLIGHRGSSRRALKAARLVVWRSSRSAGTACRRS